MEAEDVPIINGVGDGVGVELFLEQILRGAHGGLGVLNLLQGGIGLEDGRAGEAEELGAGEELFNGLMILPELGAVALIKDEDDAFVLQDCQQLLVGGLVVPLPLLVAFAGFIQREAELLDGGDDDLVGVVLGQQAADEGGSVGVFLDTAFLEAVELLPRLAVEVLAVHDEDAFVDGIVFLEQRGGLEGGECLAAAGGVPDEAVSVVVIDALHHVLHGIDLVGPHDHELLLGGDEHHVAADGPAEVALFQEGRGEVIEVGDFFVRLIRKLIDGQEALVLIEREVLLVVVGEVAGVRPVADNEELHKAEQRLGVAVAGIVLVIDDLLHGPAWRDFEGLQLDLHTGHAIDEDEHIEAVVAVVRVDAELVDDLEGVFAPVLDVDEGVVQRRAVIAREAVDLAESLGGGEDIVRDDLIQQLGELAIGEADTVESLKFLPEVFLQRSPVGDVRSVFIFQAAELLDKGILDVSLADNRTWQWIREPIGVVGGSHRLN